MHPYTMAWAAVLCLASAAAQLGPTQISDEDTWMTKADRKTECQDKLGIVKDIYYDSDANGDFESTADVVNGANGDGYPENSLGYVWCARFKGGIQSAKDDVKNNIEIVVAPYLDVTTLPLTTGEVDELGGNSLESDALKGIADQYDQAWFESNADFDGDEMAEKEAQYVWSGAASLDKQAPDVKEGETPPTKTSLSRVMRHPTLTEPEDDVYLCSCGIDTSDMAAETAGSTMSDPGPDAADSSDSSEDSSSAASDEGAEDTMELDMTEDEEAVSGEADDEATDDAGDTTDDDAEDDDADAPAPEAEVGESTADEEPDSDAASSGTRRLLGVASNRRGATSVEKRSGLSRSGKHNKWKASATKRATKGL